MAKDVPVDPAEPAFGGETAWHYARYRREYPTELIEHLGLRAREGRKRLLDLGCGTGQLLLQLAGHFERCIGIDPEPDMLREAVRLAHERGIRNAEWIHASAADLPGLEASLGIADLVTIGTAFHFMQPRTTLGELMRLTPGGTIAVAYNGSPMWLHASPWAAGLRTVLESRLGAVNGIDVAGVGLRACEAAMHELGYCAIERWQTTYESVIDVDFIVGHLYSALSPGRIPRDERADFEQQIKREITVVSPSGRVSETVAVRAVIGVAPEQGSRAQG